MIIHRMEQMTPEWFAIKTGIPSASSASKILTPTGKLSAQSDGYLNQLLAERAGYGDEPMEPTEWMLRGIELEPEARALFELDTGYEVLQVGGVTDDAGRAWCSPDGLVSYPVMADCEPAGVEIKCPKCSTQFAYLRNGGLPDYYKPQVHMSMAISGLSRWWFLSYFPGLDPLIVLVEADKYTAKVKSALDEFLGRLDEESARFGLLVEKAA